MSKIEKQLPASSLLEIKRAEALHNNASFAFSQLTNDEIQKRKHHIQWVKAHQMEYAGKYVALNGYCLVGEGDSYPEAYEMARKAGINKPFVTQVFAPDTTVFVGW